MTAVCAPYLSVVVPAYNEESRLPDTLNRIAEYYGAQPYAYELILVSDGSSDRTAEIGRQFCEGRPDWQVIEYMPNHGKGYAVRLGMLAAKGELVLFCDADLATPPEETEKLLKHMRDGAAVAIGSRPLKESKLVRHQPLYRELLGRSFNVAVQVLAIRGIRDTQCGFKMFTQEASQAVFKRCKMQGFSFDFEALMVARDMGYRIDEVPIEWSHQEGSKVVLMRDGPRMLRDLMILRAKGKSARLREATE